ncbi:MAG TPA: enolase C-terminal domain-like protein [Chloroflexota bacterium]|jgi:glucarate dehydratase|nr:enolase C-terminal domain-like protein [Chloroflexota bacterium]
MAGMRIGEMVVTPIACPDPPLLNHHGIHEPVFLRAIVRVRSEDGLEGVGEGPGGGLYVQQLKAASRHVIGADPYHVEALRVLIRDPRVFSTIEVALLDLIGKATGRSVTDLLGGPARRRVPFAAYLFYKEEGDDDWGQALTPEELLRQAKRFRDDFGMTVFKLKGGVLEPDEEIATVKLMRDAFGPRAGLRIDPNAAWSVETSLKVTERLRETGLEYLEDPCDGIEAMSQVARHTPIPLSTNMCVTAFEHIPLAFRSRAVQVVLGDHHMWGGLTAYRHLGVICKTLGWGLSQHSNSHLGISFAAMIHAGAAIPNLLYASDTHYPWNAASDIVRETDRFRFRDGAIDLWDAPGLGVTIDEDRLAAAAEAYQQRGAMLTRDDVSAMRERHPDWLPHMPKW